MSWGTIKRDKYDDRFSLYLRAKIGHCEVCFKPGKPDRLGRPVIGLEASHYKGRRAKSVRWSEDNVDCLCTYHHRVFGENPDDYTTWKKKKLGKRYNAFLVEANTPSRTWKQDRELWYIGWGEALKELENE